MTSLAMLCQRAFCDVRFDEYQILFSHIAQSCPAIEEDFGEPCGALIQYWDHDPDPQVQTLLDATASQCHRHGVDWKCFDDAGAQAFLRHEMGNEYLEAYRHCLHPAQRSDFFRYCYLYRHGGMWLDADLVLIDSPAPLIGQRLPVFLQRPTHGGITNWFLATPARHPLFANLLEVCLRNLADERCRARCAEQRDILTSTGVVAINRVVARHAHEHVCQGASDHPPFIVINHAQHDRLIMSGSQWLGQKLAYKRDHRSWQNWCAEAALNPLAPARQEQLRRSTDPSD